MNLTTFTIESVHGVKQTLCLETFTVGPQPSSKTTVSAPADPAKKSTATNDVRR
ncbi:hypothetical protein Poly51_50100 [Rubripirellula tenax]|uniref:Uncharacterized protein n=1 Tax=Rubripirellula tenax TaxID=2528015 RepID=A0A5C6EDV1_9BACT|nr:hypothetical protein [Rubripirellula tenax]TWU47212.1 hypothetical protein Poly51_50100 [Rubripirellula tenax]